MHGGTQINSTGGECAPRLRLLVKMSGQPRLFYDTDLRYDMEISCHKLSYMGNDCAASFDVGLDTASPRRAPFLSRPPASQAFRHCFTLPYQ